MTDRIRAGQFFPKPIVPASGRNTPVSAGRNENPPASSFEQLLQQNLVTFSHHAEMRLKQRGIVFTPEQLSRLDEAMDKAAAKGAKNSLMMLDGTALIVNVPNKTVVTAMNGTSMKDHVFTQIDSAVIIS
jgi:flagellar operon protein